MQIKFKITKIVAASVFCLTAAVVLNSFVRFAAAEEFRVVSKVFSAKDDNATSESTTLFADDRVYDFLSSPNEITVFDFPRGRIVLLDLNRKLRTELTTEKLNEFTDQLRNRASHKPTHY